MDWLTGCSGNRCKSRYRGVWCGLLAACNGTGGRGSVLTAMLTQGSTRSCVPPKTSWGPFTPSNDGWLLASALPQSLAPLGALPNCTVTVTVGNRSDCSTPPCSCCPTGVQTSFESILGLTVREQVIFLGGGHSFGGATLDGSGWNGSFTGGDSWPKVSQGYEADGQGSCRRRANNLIDLQTLPLSRAGEQQFRA